MSGFFRKIKENQLQGTYPLATDALRGILVDLAAMVTGASADVRLINACTNAAPAVATTSAAHGFLVNQRVSVSGATGLTAINGRWAINTVPLTTTLTLKDIISGAAVNGNGVFGGTCYIINLDTLQFLSGITGIAGALISTSGILASKTFTLGVFSFATLTFTAVTSGKTSQAAMIYDSTPATDATRPMIGVDDAAAGLPVLANGGDITYAPNASGFGEI